MATWGLAATIKAPLRGVLAFAAHHLDLGAHRLYIYLDDPEPETFAVLKAHPKIRPVACDADYWARHHPMRPVKHQARQTLNATHAYGRRAEIDWLGHIDADEFLWPDTTVGGALAALPDDVATARVRPLEALASAGLQGPACFKAMPLDRETRAAAARALYPEYADHIEDGFLSHVQGKVFLRTGLADVSFRIHNAVAGGQMNPGPAELPAVRLLHMHAADWDDWRARFEYRHASGAYRAELGRKGPSGLTLHEFFAALLEDGGSAALRRFYDTVCAATPEHCARLDAQGLLYRHDLQLDAKIRKHFPANA